MGHGVDYEQQARSIVEGLSLEKRCGQLLVVGFDGTELPETVANSLRAGHRGGIILFKRNLPDIETAWRLCRNTREAFPSPLPPMIALDEEGGRVSRLPPPFRKLPPMRWFGDRDDVELTRRAARWLAQQLAAIGITWNFAPVLDVDSNPENPIIGDRSFSHDPAVVTRHALAFIAGLQEQGIAACGKHFPGHGDTVLDSHLDLPRVDQPRERLEQVELAPFRQCAASGVAGMMTAHVVYPSLDATEVAATFSAPILNELLRQRLGYKGIVFSDDLEMGAVTRHGTVESAACAAIGAGCDALLICHSEAAAERAHEALVNRARSDAVMLARVNAAVARVIPARLRFQSDMARGADALLHQTVENIPILLGDQVQ